MDREVINAQTRVPLGRESSNTARVADAANGGGAGAAWGASVCSGECGREGSGNDMDGNEDVGDDGTFSQFGEPVGSAAAGAGATGDLCAVSASADDDGGGARCDCG